MNERSRLVSLYDFNTNLISFYIVIVINVFMHSGKTISFSIVIMLLFTSACYCKKQPVPVVNTPIPTSAAGGFAVIELFTSEGCSSCPAAEAALAEINDEYKQNVYVLEFHVDYWNYLGWKDVFSSSTYTERQQQYANVFHLSSTYTPQAIVNGKNELVGSDKSKLHSLINSYLQKQPSNKIELNVTGKGNSVLVKYSVSSTYNQELNIVLVQKKAQTDVRRGENSGRKLDHINVVRELKTIDAKDHGDLNITLPEGLQAEDCIIIAYTQDKGTWEVMGAAESVIN